MNVFLNILLLFVSTFLGLLPVFSAWYYIKRRAKEYESKK